MDTVVELHVWLVVLFVFAGGLMGMAIVLVSLFLMNRATVPPEDAPTAIPAKERKEVEGSLRRLSKKLSPTQREAKEGEPDVEEEPAPDVGLEGVPVPELTVAQSEELERRAEAYEAYRVQELADLLRLPVTTLHHLADKGLLDRSTIKGEPFFSSQSVLALVEARTADYAD